MRALAGTKEPIRILHIVGRMDRGGIETMIMNIYRNIDRTKVQFDFLAHYGREAAYNDEIRAMGGRIYEMPALKTDEKVYYWRYFQYIRALHKFFREHQEYRVIHGHMTNTASIYMPIAKKYGVKVMLYANGIGPITKDVNVKRAKKVLNMADVITLRDSESEKLLKKIGVTKPEIKITADPAFSLEPCSDDETKKLLEKLNINKKYVCMSVRSWSESSTDILNGIAQMADYISKKYNLLPVFIPMQYSKDKQVSEKIISLMKEKGIFVNEALEIDKLLGLISKAEASVAVRLHMLVFGALTAVPSIGIEYDPKVSSFQEYIGQPYCINPDDIANGKYKETIDRFMDEKSSTTDALKNTLPQMKDKAFENARIAVNLYNGNGEIKE